MDFESVQERLALLRASVGDMSNQNVDNVVVRKVTLDGAKGVTFNFGTNSPEQSLNKIYAVLNNLSSMKDMIKTKLVDKGLDKTIVENAINQSVHLGVLIDLVNAYKHTGYPLRTPKSNLDPIINNVMECLTQRKDYTGMDYGYTLNPDTGESRLGEGSHIIIDAEIYDKHNNKIFDIDELIEESIAVWQSIITNYHLLES